MIHNKFHFVKKNSIKQMFYNSIDDFIDAVFDGVQIFLLHFEVKELECGAVSLTVYDSFSIDIFSFCQELSYVR